MQNIRFTVILGSWHFLSNRSFKALTSSFILSTTNWHLPRALPTNEEEKHLPSASTEIEPHAAVAADLQQSLREVRVEWGPLCSRESGGTGLYFFYFYFLKNRKFIGGV